MWQVREFANGRVFDEQPRIAITEGQPPVLRENLGKLRELLASVETSAPIGLIETYATADPVVSGDSMSIWGEGVHETWPLPGEAEQFESQHSVRFIQGRALGWQVNGKWQSLAWHDDTIALIPLRAGVDEIEITYRQEDFAFESWTTRATWLVRYLRQYRYLDLRAFIGGNSSVQDGLIAGSKIVLRKSANAVGVLVGKAVNLLSRKPLRLQRDPLWRKRIAAHESQYSTISLAIPDLRVLSAKAPWKSAIVAVHGLFSCGIGIARHFQNSGSHPPKFRFEHDTFLNVTENANELVSLVRQKLGTTNLLLVAHSRGGLVARLAAAQLKSAGIVPSVEVWTYGTPHQGTPLVYAGSRTLGALYGLGQFAVGAVAASWPLQAAMRFLMARTDLPQGVLDLEPGRSFLQSVDLATASCTVESYAGDFDPQISSGSGYGVIFKKSLGRHAFNGKNDLVVPTSSSAAIGTSHTVDCDHFGYFENSSLMDRILRWGKP